MKDINNSAHIAVLTNVRKHPNADKLQLATVLGCDLIVGLNAKDGDVGIYFPSGLQLSEIFASTNDLVKRKDAQGNPAGGMFEITRRVKAIRLRGSMSDGYFCELDTLKTAGVDAKIVADLKVGDFFQTLDGKAICNKYIPKSGRAPGAPGSKTSKSTSKKKEYTMFKKHFDTTQLRFGVASLQPEDYMVVTEKAHGTSQRYCSIERAVEPKEDLGFWARLWTKFLNPKRNTIDVQLIGTRNVVLDKIDKNPNVGYYTASFREKASEPFVDKLHFGETVYYEVVGFEGEGKSIMGRCDNKKIDKEFVKTYGKETVFTYGCKDGNFDIFVYRITMTNRDGYSVDLSPDAVKNRCVELGVKPVKELFRGTVFDFCERYAVGEGHWHGLLLEAAEELAHGPSTYDPTHIKEGICLRFDKTTTPKVYKHKSMEFKILEGIIKPDADTKIEDTDGER